MKVLNSIFFSYQRDSEDTSVQWRLVYDVEKVKGADVRNWKNWSIDDVKSEYVKLP